MTEYIMGFHLYFLSLDRVRKSVKKWNGNPKLSSFHFFRMDVSGCYNLVNRE